MFPERIDKMILDGVQNPHEYYHAHAYAFLRNLSEDQMLTRVMYSDFEEWSFSDYEFSGMFSSCVAAPDLCPLARET